MPCVVPRSPPFTTARPSILKYLLWLIVSATPLRGPVHFNTLLFGVAPRDPATLTAVAVVMAVIGLLACWIPALRAARIDPAITMRAGLGG